MLSVALCLALLAGPVPPGDLAKALASLPAGGQLLLGPGEVAGTFNIPVDGVALVGSTGTRLRGSIRLGGHAGVTLRGLTIEATDGPAIDAAGAPRTTVDSCLIVGGQTGVALGADSLVSGCTFRQCARAAVASSADNARLIDNLIIDCGGRDGAGIALSGGKAALVRGNWLVRSALLVGATDGSVVEGNALSGASLELGPGAKSAQASLNTVYDAPQAVVLRDSRDSRLLGNWLLDGRFLFGEAVGRDGLGLVLAERLAGGCADNTVSGNLFQVSGAAVIAQSEAPATPRKPTELCPLLRRNRLVGNLYDRADSQPTLPLAMLLEGANRPVAVPTLAAYDPRGQLGQSDVGELGLTPRWIWVASGDQPVLLPNLADPSCEAPSTTDGLPLGWSATGPQATLTTDGDAHDGRSALQVVGRGDEREPVGWRSQRLPVLPAASYGLGVWLRTEEVQPTADDGGVVVSARWLSVTGQEVGRVVLLGPGEMPLLRRGSQPWTDLATEQTAPDQAAWLELFVGLDRAKGEVRFDALSLEQTVPAAPSLTRLSWPAKPGDPPPKPKPKPLKPWHPGWGEVTQH